MAKVHSSSS